jgi:hypothetical protein
MQIDEFKPYVMKNGVIMSMKFQELHSAELGASNLNSWKTLFKFGSKDKSKFELLKYAFKSVITFQRKKDPQLAVKRTFSFGTRR